MEEAVIDYADLARRDLRKETTPEENKILSDNPHMHYDELVAILLDVDAQLSAAKPRRLVKQQECLKNGPSGKAEWFEWLREQESWHSRATSYRTYLIARMRKVRQERSKYYAESRDGSNARICSAAVRYVHAIGSDDEIYQHDRLVEAVDEYDTERRNAIHA